MALCMAFTFIVTWVFNRTHESLPIVMLLHVGVNNTASIMLPVMFPTLSIDTSLLAPMTAATSVAAVLLIATRGRLGVTAPTALLH